MTARENFKILPIFSGCGAVRDCFRVLSLFLCAEQECSPPFVPRWGRGLWKIALEVCSCVCTLKESRLISYLYIITVLKILQIRKCLFGQVAAWAVGTFSSIYPSWFIAVWILNRRMTEFKIIIHRFACVLLFYFLQKDLFCSSGTVLLCCDYFIWWRGIATKLVLSDNSVLGQFFAV